MESEQFFSISYLFDFVFSFPVTILVSLFAYIYVYHRLSPAIHINFRNVYIRDNNLFVDITVQNVGLVPIWLEASKGYMIKFVAYSLRSDDVTKTPNFLPFTRDLHDRHSYPAAYIEPEHVFVSTEWIVPRGRVCQTIRFPIQDAYAVHFGLSLSTKPLRLATLFRQKKTTSWTRASFYFVPKKRTQKPAV